jgi:hypothetical protein
MGGELVGGHDGTLEQWAVIGHVAFIERQGVLGQHHVPVDGIGGRRDPGAVAPDEFLFFFGGAVGLLLVGALLDPQTAIGVADGLLVFLEAFSDIGAEVVLFERSRRYA